jgi:hypothetical protein
MLRGKLCGFAAGNENAVRHRGTQHVRSVRRHIVPRFAAVTPFSVQAAAMMRWY